MVVSQYHYVPRCFVTLFTWIEDECSEKTGTGLPGRLGRKRLLWPWARLSRGERARSCYEEPALTG